MKEVFLTTCFGLDHDIVLLDQFCQHYIKLGIKKENFLIVFNTSEGNTHKNIENGIKILDKHGISIKDIWCTKYESEEKWARTHNLITKFVSNDDWVVHPDADEFHEICENTYQELFEKFDVLGVNAFQGILVDRLSGDLKIPATDEISDDIFKKFPICANLSPILGISGVKLLGYRGFLRANNGSGQVHENFKQIVKYSHGSNCSLHETEIGIKYLGDKNYMNRNAPPQDWTQKILNGSMKNEVKFLVHHFKWHGRVIEKLKDRVKTYTRLNRPQLSQSKNMLEYYEKNGKFILG